MLLDELTTYGVGQVPELVLNRTLFQAVLPPNVYGVAINEYGGAGGAGVYTFDGVVVERPRVQVLVRSETYGVGRLLIEKLYRAFDVANVILSGVRYLRIEPLGPPFLLDREITGWVFACNVQIEKLVSPLS